MFDQVIAWGGALKTLRKQRRIRRPQGTAAHC